MRLPRLLRIGCAVFPFLLSGCGIKPVPNNQPANDQPPVIPPDRSAHVIRPQVDHVAPPFSKGDFEVPPPPMRKEPAPREELQQPSGLPKQEKLKEVDPATTDADDWLRQVTEKRKQNSEWMPNVEDDPRGLRGVTRCRFRFKAFQVLSGEKLLIQFNGEILLLNASLDVVDGRFYMIDGLCKPAGRYQYETTLGGTRTVEAITYCGLAPTLPPVERRLPPKPAERPTESKPEPKPESKPLPKVTITPPSRGSILMADSAALLDYIVKNPDTRSKWEREGSSKSITQPTEVELVSRDSTHSKVRLGGKEWYLDSKWVPAELTDKDKK